jgi:ParB family chromosome partitioning protein
MTLKSKAAAIDLSDLVAGKGSSRSGTETPGTQSPPPSTPRARSGVEAVSQAISVRHRVVDLEQKLHEYEQAGVVVLLDPRQVRHSRWKNRHEDSYATPEFAQLRKEIESAGRNIQPIKVRRLGDSDEFRDEYEIVYGRRRHRACLELGLPVAAIVQVVSNVEMFLEADRENRQRADLTPWEQGVMYADGLAQGLFPSQRRMAEMLGVDQSIVSRAIKLTQLPREVVEAFPSPLQIQFRWASDIADALDRDPASVKAIAQQLKVEAPRRTARDVYAALIGSDTPSSQENLRAFTSGGKVLAEWAKSPNGSSTIKLRTGALSPDQEGQLAEFLSQLLK